MSLIPNKKDITPAGLTPLGWIKVTILALIAILTIGLVVYLIYDYNQTSNEYVLGEEQYVNDSKGKFRKEYKEILQNNSDNKSNTSSGSKVNVKGGGQYISDSTRNPYKLPLYDGLTIDAEALGVKTWEVDYTNLPDNVPSKAKELYASKKYFISQETRAREGARYKFIGYSPDAKCGELVPYMEVDGRFAIASLFRWTMNPEQVPLDYMPTSEKDLESKGWGWGVAGTYMDIVFSDGTVLACICASSKGVEDWNGNSTLKDYGGYFHHDGSIFEVVQWTNNELGEYTKNNYEDYQFAAKMTSDNSLPANGNMGPSWNKLITPDKDIVKVVTYDMRYYTPEQGYKKWFTGE